MASKFGLSEIASLALQAVPSWRDIVESSELSVEPLTGGCTNLLWRVSIPQEKHSSIYPPSVVFRKYCESNIVDRETEAMVVDMLSREGLTVHVYEDTEEFRIEDFIVGTHPAEDSIFTDELLRIMAKIHNIKHAERNPIAFHRLNHLHNICEGIMQTEQTSELPLLQPFQDFQKITDEIKWLEDKFKALGFEYGLCHNDLHALNILQVEPPKPEYYQTNQTNTILIDFEYSDFNYLACEWANSFYELCMNNAYEQWPHWAKEDKWPSKARQEELVTQYLTYLKNQEPSKEKVEAFLSQIEICLLIQHLTWALWAIPSYVENCKTHAIEWGYAEYAAFRLSEYYSLKEKLLEDTKCLLHS